MAVQKESSWAAQRADASDWSWAGRKVGDLVALRAAQWENSRVGKSVLQWVGHWAVWWGSLMAVLTADQLVGVRVAPRAVWKAEYLAARSEKH